VADFLGLPSSIDTTLDPSVRGTTIGIVTPSDPTPSTVGYLGHPEIRVINSQELYCIYAKLLVFRMPWYRTSLEHHYYPHKLLCLLNIGYHLDSSLVLPCVDQDYWSSLQ